MILVPGFNPGKLTLQGTNTYLLGTGKERILIDTGEGKDEYFQKLKTILQEEQCSVSLILITHHHYDHTGGIKQVLQLSPNAKLYKNLDHNLEEDKMYDYQPLHHGQLFEVQGYKIRALAQPGHCVDHYSFLGNENTWFSGDCFLGGSSCFIQDYRQYLISMEQILQLDMQCSSICRTTIHPGHGYSIFENAKEAISKQIQHRKNRDQQIYDIIKGQTIDEIVKDVYPQIHEEVFQFAKEAVKSHLNKMLEDELIVLKDNFYYKQ